MANSDLSQVVNTTGVHSVGLPVIDRPPSGLPSYLAYDQQCLVQPMLAQSYVSSDVAVASAAPLLSVGVSTTSVVPAPSSNVVVPTPVATIGADTRATYASLGAPLPSAPLVVDTKAVPLVGSSGQTPGVVAPVAALAAPMVVVKQPEPVRPYTGTTSYKQYEEYFERICECNGWENSTERARHLLVAMDGAACEAVRGLKAEQDSDLALIWEALDRRFGYVDEPQRAIRRFDVRRQLEGETLAVFEQSLRILHREAWPKTDLKSPEADSLLRRKFVDGIQDLDLQKYLRLHAATDDFATTVSKARHFMDASELARTAKKPAIRATSTSVNYQTIVDGVMESLELHNQGRMTEVNAAQSWV